ncbi:Aste57867_20278 [Aphanomyces stellatus]|uniref:Aste57867_20278 protein n=1 Tax=Aphanomyces stellatus TaxID=120398 RepID=A0A485LG51_9STRA|nr:hypothetical protein As57867_020212 [Aphanomyces stellatus]VFT96968.1 Aste57867_20278 [Aphanomyces stellatus]
MLKSSKICTSAHSSFFILYPSFSMPYVHYHSFKPSGRHYCHAPAKAVLQATDSLVIQVHAAAINHVDYKHRQWFGVVGVDVAGVVTQVSPDVTAFGVGDRVFGTTAGALADHAVCKASEMAALPATLTFVHGAALPIAYLAAYQALTNYGFAAGMRVLVIGASGGCGSAAVQLAKALGAVEVVGVCSQKNQEFVKSLGADNVLDYETQPLTADGRYERYFDFVLDTATGNGDTNYLEPAKAVLKDPAMHHVTLNDPTPSQWLRRLTGVPRPEAAALLVTQHNKRDLDAIVELLDRTKQVPAIDSIVPFTEAGVEAAFAKLQSRRARGRVVIDVSGAGAHP